MKIIFNKLLFIVFSVFIVACNTNLLEVDVSGIEVDAKAQRFDKELFNINGSLTLTGFKALQKKYGSFFELFTHSILDIPEGPDTMVAHRLSLFITDTEVSDIHRLTDSVYSSMIDVEQGMEVFLKHLSYHFPDKPAPGVVTYISAFNYAVITTDSVIGIGLDMFLGENMEYYPRMGIPKYMFSKFRREYIVPSAIKAWFQSEYDIAGVKNELLSQLIYQGKLLYFSKAMSPGIHDTLITGYTSAQLDWAKKSEADIWAFFIENNLLFNTDASLYAKFVNDGPATSGFPKEAPGKLGAFIGWQIVKQYAEKNSELSLPEILAENDSQKILEQSGYKPKK